MVVDSKTQRAVSSANTAAPAPAPALVGLWLHIIKNGRIENQAQIIGRERDYVLAQRFSWWDGHPTDILPIETAMLFSDKVVLYPDEEAMVEAHFVEQSKYGELREGSSVDREMRWWRQLRQP